MTPEVTPPARKAKVPVWRTAIDSYRFVFANLDRFFALGWLPLLITFAAYMAIDSLARVGGGEKDLVGDWLTDIALEAVSLAVYAVFAVRWHRFFLLGEHESVFIGIFSPRDWRFLGYLVLLTFAPMVPMIVMSFVLRINFAPEAGPQAMETFSWILVEIFTLGGLILFFVMIRFSLVLPGTAVDRSLGLGEAWRKMLGHTWRFIGAFFLAAILYVIPLWIVSAIFGQSLSGGITSGAPEPTIGTLFATNAAMAIFGFLATAAGITVLSIFYRHIVGMDAPEGGESGAAAGP